MGGKKTRINSLIDELPDDIKEQVNIMIAHPKYTYEYIQSWLLGKGYSISKSSVFRYAKRYSAYLARIDEANKDIEMIINAVKDNPKQDFTDAGAHLLTAKLTRRIAMAEDEFDTMSLNNAGKLMVQLSRTKAYKDKIRQEQKTKLELAFEQFEGNIMKIIGTDPELSLRFESQIKALIEDTKAKAMLDEN